MQNIDSLMSLINIIDTFYNLIDGRVAMDNDGWPIFQREHFLNEWPDDMVTFQNRNNKFIANKECTTLCFYEPDSRIYPRFYKITNEIVIYQEFAGVVFPDITVTTDMDIEMQEAMMLAFQLFAAVLASNEIKLVLNTRCGVRETQQRFSNIPSNVMCASGFLGCQNATDFFTASVYVDKILRLRPQKLIIYGKQDQQINQQLNSMGISYRYYDDFHSKSRKKVA